MWVHCWGLVAALYPACGLQPRVPFGKRTRWKIKANGFPIIGSYGTPDASGEHIAVHVDAGTDAGIPTDYWWLTAADYYWEAYQPVEIDTP